MKEEEVEGNENGKEADSGVGGEGGGGRARGEGGGEGGRWKIWQKIPSAIKVRENPKAKDPSRGKNILN